MNYAALAEHWDRDTRLWEIAAESLNASFAAKGDDAAPVHARSAGSGDEAAGLVSYKTSGNDPVSDLPVVISTDPLAVRDRRIKALRRNVWAAGKLLSNAHGKNWRCWFVTLTYRGVDDWSPRHISEALRRFRHWCKKRGTAPHYVWVAELQQRGAMHYHLAIWLPSGLSCPMWDKPQRDGAAFWPHGMTNRQLARNAVGYLMKYMSKIGKHHEYPKHARIYGAGGLEQQDRQIRSWLNWPTWLKQLHGVGEVVVRKGRRMVRETGEILASPYRLLRTRYGLQLQTVGPVPETWASGPYSAWGVTA